MARKRYRKSRLHRRYTRRNPVISWNKEVRAGGINWGTQSEVLGGVSGAGAFLFGAPMLSGLLFAATGVYDFYKGRTLGGVLFGALALGTYFYPRWRDTSLTISG